MVQCDSLSILYEQLDGNNVWNLCNSSRIAVAVVFLLILDGVGVPVAVGSSTTVVPVVADYIVPIMGLSAILAVGNSVCRSRRQQLGTLSSVPQCPSATRGAGLGIHLGWTHWRDQTKPTKLLSSP